MTAFSQSFREQDVRERQKIDTYQAIKLLAESFDVMISKTDWDLGFLVFNGADDNLEKLADAMEKHPVLSDISIRPDQGG